MKLYQLLLLYFQEKQAHHFFTLFKTLSLVSLQSFKLFLGHFLKTEIRLSMSLNRLIQTPNLSNQ
ncbi:hypothetical protein HMPREF0812_01199 [Streptococcus agalactiae]|nr:putative succinyl-diaminopimelate desuccinylase [Streptococcus agalactiae CNCTC 10/84]ETJ94415.1 hypothetical protein HMPREF1256_1372 [Streptococcus agalactiae BV3L5]KXA41696.1 hypothetical protein HMPREF1883_01858 [Streptococcus agalactiae]KXA53160.1 hypothetical protein HMPREF1881_00528 [Streptococcus agalactiae]KXA56094.1 hypothetical protein HMPREF0812_01199 [Streptococcus agalactiae]